jgi:predicted transglutaminase-like cysteine proteinase
MTYASVALACAFVLSLSATPQAQGADLSAPSVTPLAMQFFCSQTPAECLIARDIVAEWTPQLAALLSEVNARVNRDIRPRADPQGAWEISPAFGDCNDYALTKRSRLIRLGVPAGSLRMAITTKNGAPHAILIVKTSAGDVVLDNLSSQTRTLGQSGYSIGMISTANPLRWARL